MLQVGVDTYITIEEMNQYVTTHFVSSDALRVQWEATSEEDQEVWLRRAFDQINSLPYTGRPKNPKQKLPFPRHGQVDFLNVKYAQAEQAIAITDTVEQQEINDRLRLRRAGVTEYRIGDLQEKFNGQIPSASNGTFFGLAEKAYSYLSKWLRGGYKVCTSIKPHYGIRWWYPLV